MQKVALDMYMEQMKWSMWFIGIIMAVYIGLGLSIVGGFYGIVYIA